MRGELLIHVLTAAAGVCCCCCCCCRLDERNPLTKETAVLEKLKA
jgi:hypothetical protein